MTRVTIAITYTPELRTKFQELKDEAAKLGIPANQHALNELKKLFPDDEIAQSLVEIEMFDSSGQPRIKGYNQIEDVIIRGIILR